MELEQKQKALKCAIICGGVIDNIEWLKAQLKNYNYIIAADSGYDYCSYANIIPNVVIGDFDSVKSDLPDNIKKVEFPPVKDDTDFALCLKFCRDSGIINVDVYGSWGNRADHSFAAVFSMLKAAKFGINVTLKNESSEMLVVSDYLKIPRTNGYVSVFAIGRDTESVTLKGFKYPLNNYHLACCNSLGVSNKITSDYGEIYVKNGDLLVIIQN